ncbi:MAG: hypothetical protein ACI4MS_04855 [Candidatus Coproplasma sp.]
MEAETYHCPYCGVSIDATAINFKTRRASCKFCGMDVVFPKRTSTASPSATLALSEATKFFLEKNFSSAKSCAERVVSMVPANAPALYIIAYYNAYVADIKNRDSMERLFNETLDESALEVEEEECFKQLLLKTVFHAWDYEEQIMQKFCEYDDNKELGEFVEAFSPIAISKRTNTNWLTPKLAGLYAEIAKKTNIPKTCFALLTSISKNPQSPLSTGEFFLKTKTTNFYNNYLLPIGTIINSMGDPALRAKFAGAFNKVKADFESKMKN